MKRTPPWVFVAAAGVQLAALGLCVWAMEWLLRSAQEAPQPDAAPAAPAAPGPVPVPQARVLAAAPHLAPGNGFVHDPAVPAPDPIYASGPAPVPEAAPDPEPAPPPPPPPEPQPEPQAAPEPEPHAVPEPPPAELPRASRAIVRAVQPLDRTAVPRFGPPPERQPVPPDPNAIPRFIAELADATTQIVRGRTVEGRFAFGFYPDGNIRFVDVDGGRYAGKLESARARMREDGGMRAFTVQIGVAADRRLQATFTGGPHEGATILLEPLVGWSVA